MYDLGKKKRVTEEKEKEKTLAKMGYCGKIAAVEKASRLELKRKLESKLKA